MLVEKSSDEDAIFASVDTGNGNEKTYVYTTMKGIDYVGKKKKKKVYASSTIERDLMLLGAGEIGGRWRAFMGRLLTRGLYFLILFYYF